ncbi:MAG: Riboflavin biosynthesis protein [Magnetococcales bacterium]|nr:Riboflavin biosynthesis protein [Magnetococcales bacterium]HIJ84968.1 bifunctional riboflavin kinase/FAD synthetase [Magnetococcales bacterium]
MYIIRGNTNITPRFTRAVVTIGNFDGVHRGHQTIFSHLQSLSRRHGDCPKVVITFEPHPRQFLAQERAMARITRLRAKVRRLEQVGVDGVFVLRFNRELAQLSAVDFVQRHLVAGLRVREVLVGENFRFGCGGEGNLETLRQLGEYHGFGVHGQPLMRVADTVISSSMIREAVVRGDLEQAGVMLGRSFEMEGRVVPGVRRGRILGFPTANIPVKNMLHPPMGVWIVQGWVDGHWCRGVANLGNNPTFGQGWVSLETHLLNFDADLYRRWLRVRFLKFIRPERKFPGVDALKERIAQDVSEAESFFFAMNSKDQGVE